MGKKIEHRRSWARIREETYRLSEHPEENPAKWIYLILEVLRNQQRFPNNRKWPKIREIIEAFGHLPASKFDSSYFISVMNCADMAAESGRNPLERKLLGWACGDIKMYAGLKLTRFTIDSPPLRRAPLQPTLFGERPSNR